MEVTLVDHGLSEPIVIRFPYLFDPEIETVLDGLVDIEHVEEISNGIARINDFFCGI